MIRVKNTFRKFFYDSKLTQTEFAQKLGTDQPRVSQFLNGKMRPSINEVDKMCEALDCQVEDIIEFIKEETK